MSHTYSVKTAGFTAVELLITLFVAAAFLTAGYQLFSLVIQDGGDTRAEATVNNEAYNYLRQYTNAATNPCAVSTPISNSAVTIEGVTDSRITVSISCPQTSTPSLSRVEVAISYQTGSGAKSIIQATYVDKSRGAF